MERVFDRYSAEDLRAHFASTGLLRAVEERGYTSLDVSVRSTGMALPHIELHGTKSGKRYLLLESCLTETALARDENERRGLPLPADVRLLVAYWLREQDPSRPFEPDRPRLPLQEHPGLGVLPIAFQTLRRLAEDMRQDGIACMPKFFHDAYIFIHSRLFSFLDPLEQGRFQRMLADLHAVPVGDVSRAFLETRVVDDAGRRVDWNPGLQVCPLRDVLTDYFNSPAYAAGVDRGEAEPGYAIRSRLDAERTDNNETTCAKEGMPWPSIES